MIRGLFHVGISVSNLERSIRFYGEGLGLEVLVNGAFAGERYERILGLPGARGRVALLKGPDLQLELFEFAAPQPRASDVDRPVCDHGISHFCIGVTDIDMAYRRLSDAGARFHCPPLEFPKLGKATYGRDIDGNVFELFEAAGSATP
jgi:catechol 2,3-dioxygenase-like lactoylglutathione lyase family enzyme